MGSPKRRSNALFAEQYSPFRRMKQRHTLLAGRLRYILTQVKDDYKRRNPHKYRTIYTFLSRVGGRIAGRIRGIGCGLLLLSFPNKEAAIIVEKERVTRAGDL